MVSGRTEASEASGDRQSSETISIDDPDQNLTMSKFRPEETLPPVVGKEVVVGVHFRLTPLFVFGHISGTIHPIGTSDRLKERPEISLSKLFERRSPIFISFAQKIDR